MSRVGRHRTTFPEEGAAPSPAPDDISARLLGQRRSMGPREVSAKASVSIRSARKFWQALGLPDADEEDPVFTEADLLALQSVATLVRDGVFDEPTALGMTRAFARTTEGLAVWQVQLIADAMGRMAHLNGPPTAGAGETTGSETTRSGETAGSGETSRPGGTTGSGETESANASELDSGRRPAGAVPDPATARAAAVKLADIADDLEPLLIYAWRRHLSAAITRLVTEGIGEGDEQRWAHG
jgi:adenylate cyclase